MQLATATLGIALVRPVELVDRLSGRRELRHKDPDIQLPPNRPDALAAAHELVGVASCDDCAGEVASVADEVQQRLPTGHRHDGCPVLGEVLWAVVRHTRPERVVETGVARGISSAFILAALERNGSGQLWSIDLPSIQPARRVQTGMAVPDRLRHRWTYRRGASRRHLPRLLDELGTVDLFLHDGLHTRETQALEFDAVWSRLSPGGVLLADDAQASTAFVDLARRTEREPLVVAQAKASDHDGAIGLLRA